MSTAFARVEPMRFQQRSGRPTVEEGVQDCSEPLQGALTRVATHLLGSNGSSLLHWNLGICQEGAAEEGAITLLMQVGVQSAGSSCDGVSVKPELTFFHDWAGGDELPDVRGDLLMC